MSGVYQISHLDLRQNPLGNEGIKILAKGIASSNSLIHLDLRSTAFRREGANSLFKALEENNTVNCLQIGNLKGLHRNMLNGKAISGIESYLSKTSILTFLDLENAGIGHEGLGYLLKGLKLCNSVKVLNIALNNLEAMAGSLIIEFLLKTKLKRLNISHNLLGNLFLVMFNQYVKDIHYTITHLSLSSCGLYSSDLVFLFDALKRGVSLEHLELDGIKYDEISLKRLAQFISTTTVLKSFSSAGCMLGDIGIEIASEGFPGNYTLEAINFSGNRISDKGVIVLSHNLLSMRNKRLKTINVSNNLIEVFYS